MLCNCLLFKVVMSSWSEIMIREIESPIIKLIEHPTKFGMLIHDHSLLVSNP